MRTKKITLLTLFALMFLSMTGCNESKCSEHVFGDWHVEKGMTCLEDGKEYRYCLHCDYRQERTIYASEEGHDWTLWSDDENAPELAKYTIEPTCYSEGVRYRFCKLTCDKDENGNYIPKVDEDGCFLSHYSSEKIAKTSHHYESGVIISDPTCTTYGKVWKSCTNPGCEACYVATDTSRPLLDHDYTCEVVSPDYFVGLDPEHGAIYYKSCSMCGRSSGAESLSSKKVTFYHVCEEHTIVSENASEYLIDNATCTHGSVYYKHCSTCGLSAQFIDELVGDEKTYVNDDLLPECEVHAWSEGIENSEHTKIYYTCTVCGKVREEDITE